MANAMCINKQEVTIKEYQGQRVVTFREIDQVHNRPRGTARRNFHGNKEYFELGKDYFVRNSYEAKKEYGITAPNGITLITESGYLMLCKSFGDKLAWGVQRQLVNVYFQKKAPIAEPSTLAQAVTSGTRVYHGQPVMTLRDVYNTVGVTKAVAHYYLQDEENYALDKDYLLLKGEELRGFKRENSDIHKNVSTVIIMFLPAIEKLCKKVGVKFNSEKFMALPVPKEAPTRAMKKAETRPTEEKNPPEKPFAADEMAELLRDRAAALNVIATLYARYGNTERYAYPLRNTAWLIASSLCMSDAYRAGGIMEYDPKPNAAL